MAWRRPLVPVDTPYNTAAVQSHVVAVLDEHDSLAVQDILVSTPTRTEPCNLESLQERHGSGSDLIRGEPPASAKQPQEKKGPGPLTGRRRAWSMNSIQRQGDKITYQ